MHSGLIALVVASHLTTAGPAQDCARAAVAAERRWHLPTGLLLAIGTVESGQQDATSHRVLPWPWTLDAAGTPYVLDAEQEAAAVTGFLRDRGVGSIDVGCFQVNLQAHPDAFATMAQAFDPMTNAAYAARLLRSLYDKGRDWSRAIGWYHSPDEALATPYAARVMRVWSKGTVSVRPNLSSGDPHVILIDASAVRIPVYTTSTLPASLRAQFQLTR